MAAKAPARWATAGRWGSVAAVPRAVSPADVEAVGLLAGVGKVKGAHT